MAANLTLTPEQLDEFDRRGVLRLSGLLCAERVRRALEYVQVRLARRGLWKEGAWCLTGIPRPQWPSTGLRPAEAIGNKHPDVLALADDPALCSVVVALLEGCEFDHSIHRRPQVLFTLPNSDTWTVPTGWHVDVPRLASGRRPGVQLFAFLDTVQPRGGGTLVIAGSHRLLNEGRLIKVRQMRSLLCREAFFRDLYSAAPHQDRTRLLGQAGKVGDVALEVMELTGAPGDAYLIDLRLLHSGAPNATDRPRIMATHRFVRADIIDELNAAVGWE
jgi:ectoine hydroxylase-related dioxygenase (phytanoyl-CoA dioxygenase family)